MGITGARDPHSPALTCSPVRGLHLRKHGNALVAGDVDAFLGVKGSPVQIRPSRRFFEHLYPEMGTKTTMIIPTGTSQHEHTIQADGQAIPMTRAPMAEIPARRAG